MNTTDFLNVTTRDTEILVACLLAGRTDDIDDDEIDRTIDLALRINMRTLARINSMPRNVRFELINKKGRNDFNIGKQWDSYDIENI